MRQIFMIALMLAPFGVSAQVGTVRYTHTYPLLHSHYYVYRAFASEEYGAKPIVPEIRATVSRSMVFDATASLMYPTDKPHVEPGDRKTIDGEEDIDTTYIDFGGGTYTESRVVDMEVYLVNDWQPSIPWRLEDEERLYLDFRVMKATAEMDSAVIEAWFTPEIPIPAGPGLYGGLPGVILMITNEAHGEVYTAESVDLDVLTRAIVPPTRGRKMSDKKYSRVKESVMEEDRRFWEEHMRDIRSGKIKMKRRSGK